MKNTTNTAIIKIEPKACSAHTNPESSATGDAATAINLRECEQGLVVASLPSRIAKLSQGEKLLLVDGDNIITATGGSIVCNGTAICSTYGADAISAHKHGQFISIITSTGVLHLAQSADGTTALSPHDAVPLINLCETEAATATCPLSAYTFSAPLTSWQSPLPSEDVACLAKREAQARLSLTSSANAQGRHCGMMLVRYGVRLHDDSYLWLSAPVLLGGGCASGNFRHLADAVTAGSTFSGISASTLSAPTYRIGITVLGGISSKWHGLVKAIDVLATREIMPYDTSTLDYRFVSRPSQLDFGPMPRSKQAVVAQLLRSDWHIVASTSNLDALSTSEFSAYNAPQSSQTHFPGLHTHALASSAATPTALTASACAAVTEPVVRPHIPACATVANGSLVLAGGMVRNTCPWNPATLFGGNITRGNCTLATSVTLATPQGFATVTRTDDLPFVPSSLNDMVAYPDTRAVSMTFVLTLADASQLTCSTPLTPMPESSVAISSALTALTFTAAKQRRDLTASDFTEPASGTISVSKPGNPFAQADARTHTGLTISSICAAERPLYSGGFGRYPLYVFTTSGIYALPGTASSGFGEPRVIADIIASTVAAPCCGNGSVWFIDSFSRLCRLSGIKTEIIATGIEATALAWDGCHRELAVATPGGAMLAIQPSGRIASRTVTATTLTGSNTRAYATTADGTVFDLSADTAQKVTASYLSQPVVVHSAPLGARLTQIIWNVCGTVSNAELRVLGERGLSCHGFLVNSTRVNGTLAASLPIKLVSRPLRTFRVAISGTFAPGTLFLPITVTASATHVNY